MKIKHLLYIIAGFSLMACNKDSVKPVLPAGSVTIQGFDTRDSLVRQVGIAKDTAMVIALKAVLTGAASTGHTVDFRADTTRITSYRAKYGAATLLPTTSYFFFRSRCRIPAGASVSDSMQLNIVTQTTLKPETVYVLPVIIQSVDGRMNDAAADQTFYVVVKTGSKPVINKSNWSIVSVSNELDLLGAYKAVNLLDNDVRNTIWATDFGAPMPQHVVIDFGEILIFSGVTCRSPDTYYASYGYPTRFKVEVSMDGSTWTDKGSYNAGPAPVSQSIGITTARYMRFTVLAIAPYTASPSLSLLALSDIGLIP